MKHLLYIILLSLISGAADAQECIDLGWKFFEQDAKGAEAVTFDDSKWQAVNLPHDWSIHHTPEKDSPTSYGGGFYPGGIGWYRKTIDVKKYVKTQQPLALHFEGVYERCEVYVNGKLAGKHHYGYTPFTVEIAPSVYVASPKGKMTVAVRVDNSNQPNCRWYSGSGIYRHVWLMKGAQDKSYFVTTKKIYGIAADGLTADSAVVTVTTTSKDGAKVLAQEQRTFKQPKLWSPDQPALYDVKVDGKVIKFGIREFTYNAKEGAKLNGQPLLMFGACVHHDNGMLGTQAFDKAEVRKVKQMKEAGFNLIRTAHNPPSVAMLNACDSIGMLVLDELFDGWKSKKNKYDYSIVLDSCYHEDVAAFIMRDRNHPSIIAWSIGNEVFERGKINVIQTAKKITAAVREFDTTRPITEAHCGDDWEAYDPHMALQDIVGYNYLSKHFRNDHQRLPERVMWATESYVKDAFQSWKDTHELPYVIGDMIWTGLDYVGEAGIGRFHYKNEPAGEPWQGEMFPWHGAYCGDIDLTGWRKPISHYRQMLWHDYTTVDGKQTPLYLAVKQPDLYGGTDSLVVTRWSSWPTWESWNWSGWEGKPIEVEVYSKLPEVSLYLNDKLIETKAVSEATEFKAVFTLPYQPGVLRAEGRKQGEVYHSSQLKTSGAPAKVRLTSDVKTVKANGMDIAYIVAEVLDADGNIVPDAAEKLQVTVAGAGTLLATGNADMKDMEPYTTPVVTTWKGRALIVVRSTQKSGKIAVSVAGIDNKAIKGTCEIKNKN